MDVFLTVLKWLLISVAVAPIVGSLCWIIFEGSIRPRMITRSEIDALANDILQRYPDDPEEAAFNETYSAWHRSETFEQGKWHRVRKELRRRNQSAG